MCNQATTVVGFVKDSIKQLPSQSLPDLYWVSLSHSSLGQWTCVYRFHFWPLPTHGHSLPRFPSALTALVAPTHTMPAAARSFDRTCPGGRPFLCTKKSCQNPDLWVAFLCAGPGSQWRWLSIEQSPDHGEHPCSSVLGLDQVVELSRENK